MKDQLPPLEDSVIIHYGCTKFENKEHKEKLYKAVYESADWMNDIGPKVATLIDRNSIAVHNLTSTELSIMK